RRAPTVPRLIEIHLDAVMTEIKDIGDARTVDIGEANAALVEQIRSIEPGGIVLRHLGAEAAIAEIRPIADLAVADAHEICQPVARHVVEVDGLRDTGQDEPWSFFLVRRLAHPLGWSEARLRQRGVPVEDLVLADENIGMAVTGEIDEGEIGIVPAEIGQR